MNQEELVLQIINICEVRDEKEENLFSLTRNKLNKPNCKITWEEIQSISNDLNTSNGNVIWFISHVYVKNSCEDYIKNMLHHAYKASIKARMNQFENKLLENSQQVLVNILNF